MNTSKLIRVLFMRILLPVLLLVITLLAFSMREQNAPTDIEKENGQDLQDYLQENFDDIGGKYYKKGLTPEEAENFTYGPMTAEISRFNHSFTYEKYKEYVKSIQQLIP